MCIEESWSNKHEIDKFKDYMRKKVLPNCLQTSSIGLTKDLFKYIIKSWKLMIDLPQFQELLEEVGRGFLVEGHWDMISCQNAIPQFFHKSAPPDKYQKRKKSSGANIYQIIQEKGKLLINNN